jgi:hypothetical protein
MTTQNITTRTEKIVYFIQRELNSIVSTWRDTWKYDNLEEAQKNLLDARKTYPSATYRLVKREEVEEVYSM